MAATRFSSLLTSKLFTWKTLCGNKLCMSSQSSASMLAKLRKMTGYSMSNCKKALSMHADDIERAKVWLDEEARKQGWSKIANLENRPAAQGLVAVCSKNSIGAMVEVNCETDFVSRNAEFQQYVTKVLSSCLDYSASNMMSEDCQKVYLDPDTLSKLTSGSNTLGDLTASAVGKFGEKTVLRRAVCFKTGHAVLLSSFSHPHTLCPDLADASFGKYGGLVAYRLTQAVPDISNEMLLEFGHQLCHHIIGMNPQTIGDVQQAVKSVREKTSAEENIEMKKLEADDRKDDIIIQDKATEESEEQNEEDEQEHDTDKKLVDSNESRLVFQQFLMDPTLNVAEYLIKNSIEVLDFERFECGEDEKS